MTSTNDHNATTDTTGAASQSAPSAHDAVELLRAFTATGEQLYDRERATREGHNYATGPDVVAAAIGTLDWQTPDEQGQWSMPFSPGEGIKTLMHEVGVREVSRLAWNGAVEVHDDPEHSTSLYGLYGIEGIQNGFPVRLYAVDRGTDLLIVAVDAPHALAVRLDPTVGQTRPGQ